MQYQERFSDSEIETIVAEGTIYMCACPAYLAEAIREIRALYHYQQNCLQTPSNDVLVHQTIAETAIVTHAQLEECMEKILDLEKWDRTTLQMPANLRVKQMKAILEE